MNFTFNSSQANELLSQLRLGQIIKVQVIEKTGNSHYLISYKNLQLTAASEVDLFTKSVWLRVVQKAPYPKLQIIIEEDHSCINELFEYADQNDLLIPSISKQLKDFIASYGNEIQIHNLYDFINWYSDKVTWGIFTDFNLLFLLGKGMSFRDLTIVYDDFCLRAQNPDTEDFLLATKLLSTMKDIETISAEMSVKERLTVKIALIEKVNAYLCEHNIQLSLLYIHHSRLTLVIPVKLPMNSKSKLFTGLVDTKHFGKISFKYESFGDKVGVFLIFESGLFMNSLKADLTNCINKNNVDLLMSVQSTSNTQGNLHNEWSYVV